MFEWIKFIGEFIAGIVDGVGNLMTMFSDAIAIFTSAMYLAPSFLVPILLLTVSVAIVMWVVNIF